jgi:hypothetical protein
MDTATAPLVDLTEDGQIEFSIDIPGPEEYVPCEQCDSTVKDGRIASSRSYMHFHFMDGLFSFCKHHGERNEEKLKSLGASLVADYRDRLIENRLKGDL